MNKILVICAHPDDETLGLGGTIKIHSKNGDKIYGLICTEGESARGYNEKKIVKRQNQAKKAASLLGIHEMKFLDYQDQKLDSVPTLDIIKKIESEIKRCKPNIIYTHFWGDLNQDHRKIFEATMIAARPLPDSSIKKLYCYEIPSSTEYGIKKFKPNTFVNIENELKIKLKAVKIYENEIRKYPHPRSEKALIVRSEYWGSTVGIKNAEAFVLIRDLK